MLLFDEILSEFIQSYVPTLVTVTNATPKSAAGKPASKGCEAGMHPDYSDVLREVVRSVSVRRDQSPRLLTIRLKLGAAA